MERKFNSMTEEVKVLMNEFMAGVSGECDRKEIVAYVKEQISDKEKLTDGIIAGALKILTATGEVVVVRRARYKRGVKLDSLCLRDKVIALFEGFQRDLQKTCTMNLLGVSNEDVEFIRKVSVLSDQLESDIWKLEESENQEVEAKKQVVQTKKEEVEAKNQMVQTKQEEAEAKNPEAQIKEEVKKQPVEVKKEQVQAKQEPKKTEPKK